MKKHIVNILKIILIVLFLELTLFNINSYRLAFGNYEKAEYEMNNEDYASIIKNNVVTQDDTIVKEITGINKKIGTIRLNINANRPMTYRIYYTDENSKEYREMPSKILVDSLDNSKSIPCFLAGNTDKIKVEIEVLQSTNIELDSIEINEPISFQFNIVRFIVLSVICIFIYAMFKMEVFQKAYSKTNKKQVIIILLIEILFIGIMAWCFQTSAPKGFHYGENYAHKFVDAISNGQISLLDEPSEELKQMENPYDETARRANNVGILWDVAYYNGNYFVYFGILPILTLLLPFKAITGDYIDAQTAVLIYSIIAVILMVRLIKLIFRKWFKEVPFKMMILTIISVIMGSLLIWLCRRPDMYELVISAGICFAILGILLILKCIEKEKVNYIYLTCGCIAMALSVACRPTQLFASIVILPILLKIVVDNIKQKQNILKSILAIVLPYGVVGISLMIYNYVRFENILEFGTSYQITINDMGNLPYRIMTIPVGLLNYFFTLPQTSTFFPFVVTTEEVINFYGYYVDSQMAGGLLILNPVILALLFIPKVKKHISKDLFIFIVSLLVSSFVIVIAEIIIAGSTQRYAADFAWMLVLAGMLVILAIYNIIKNQTFRKYMFMGVFIVVLYSFIVGFLLYGIQGENNTLYNFYNDQYYGIRYAISFWE